MKKSAILWAALAVLSIFNLAGAETATPPDTSPAVAAPAQSPLLQEILGTPAPRPAATCLTTGWCTCFTNDECQRFCAGQCANWAGYCNFSQGECGSCVCTAPVC